MPKGQIEAKKQKKGIFGKITGVILFPFRLLFFWRKSRTKKVETHEKVVIRESKTKFKIIKEKNILTNNIKDIEEEKMVDELKKIRSKTKKIVSKAKLKAKSKIKEKKSSKPKVIKKTLKEKKNKEKKLTNHSKVSKITKKSMKSKNVKSKSRLKIKESESERTPATFEQVSRIQEQLFDIKDYLQSASSKPDLSKKDLREFVETEKKIKKLLEKTPQILEESPKELASTSFDRKIEQVASLVKKQSVLIAASGRKLSSGGSSMFSKQSQSNSPQVVLPSFEEESVRVDTVMKGAKKKEYEVIEKLEKFDRNLKQTNFDKVYTFVKENKNAKAGQIAKGIGIKRQDVVKIIEVLEEHGLVILSYPLIGDVKISLKENRDE